MCIFEYIAVGCGSGAVAGMEVPSGGSGCLEVPWGGLGYVVASSDKGSWWGSNLFPAFPDT